MSPSDQFMAANVVLVVTFQFVFFFLAQVATKNCFLTLFYGALNSLVVYVILGALFLEVPVKSSDVYKNNSPVDR